MQSFDPVCFACEQVIKTRLQVQGEMKAAGAARYKGVGDAIVQIARQEGIWSLQKGLVPGMIYQVPTRCLVRAFSLFTSPGVLV